MANSEHVEILKQGVKAWNKWREENPTIVPDLKSLHYEYADLRYINFFEANLTDSNLQDSNMEGANLESAECVSANLINVNLKNAFLVDTHFNAASLVWTDLTGAEAVQTNLNNADLHHTNLKRTNLLGSTVAGTRFSELDLKDTINLHTLIHMAPSTIDINTIYLSQGQIPEIFLRGCGVPENFITYMQSLTINPIEYFSCFISYSHHDKSFARRLHDQLQARGIRCWLDDHQILPGDDIYEQVDRGIRLWDKVLLCCSEHSLSSWWVDNEVATAFSKEQQLMKDRRKKVLSLIPLNLDGYMFSDEWASGKRQQIKERLAADFTGWETNNSKFEEQFERVVKALQTEGAREGAPVGKL